MESDIANLNRATWSRADAIADLRSSAGFIDAGERASLLAVAPRVRGQAALDVGVGTGRTSALLRLLTDDYIAIDYTPAMVDECRRMNPDVDVRLGDVRDLRDFRDGQFGLVFFSYSGIDALGHDDRARALREMFRVLRPGGWLAFSTHNQDGPSAREVPWRGYATHGPAAYRALRWLVRFPFAMPRYARRWSNWRRNRKLTHVGGDWSVLPAAPHDFGLVIHYVTLKRLVAEVAEAGFTAVEVYDSERGAAVSVGDDTRPDMRDVHAFHVVAQRPLR